MHYITWNKWLKWLQTEWVYFITFSKVIIKQVVIKQVSDGKEWLQGHMHMRELLGWRKCSETWSKLCLHIFSNEDKNLYFINGRTVVPKS